MNQKDWLILEKRATEWIKEAGERLKQSFSAPLEVSCKSAHNDLVTNMDKEIEKFLVGKIKDYYPDHKIVSEEGFGDAPGSTDGVVWFLDPIDGTINFVMQRRFFAISIGVYENGAGKAALIYDVMAGELFHCLAGNGAFRNETRLAPLKKVAVEDALIDLSATWIKPNRRIDQDILTDIVRRCSGTRAYGAASIELAYVAAGLIDAYFTMRLSPWDFAAGLILIDEVGGTATRADGTAIDLLSVTSILTAGPELHGAIARHIGRQTASGKFLNEPH
ncbi:MULTISPECIES: inositol monophosphatase family protein [unclassified Sporolactobacillus]|uniref:inositol monophosphatase family protein n=1 Tax=unclassified Sporolactobacillus TaxID=2628533 RepID=UPI0023675E68|nr:inositol monophosphatase family protein [Sporolactobacillus sp. CQH2019]MDD9147191.1 inositol monophosphatase family protein [Sporolactobacillus sp. CQH2019]